MLGLIGASIGMHIMAAVVYGGSVYNAVVMHSVLCPLLRYMYNVLVHCKPDLSGAARA